MKKILFRYTALILVLTLSTATTACAKSTSESKTEPVINAAMASVTEVVSNNTESAEIIASGEISEGRQYWTLDNDGTLIISGTGKMQDFVFTETHGESGMGYNYTNIPWYYKLSTEELPYDLSEGYGPLPIKKLYVQDGIQCIGDCAFYGLKDLTDVSLPESLESIGSSAFSLCTKLGAIVLCGGQTYGESSSYIG